MIENGDKIYYYHTIIKENMQKKEVVFVLKLPVLTVYVILNMDEIVKLPAVYHHYKKYRWISNLTKDFQQEEEI